MKSAIDVHVDGLAEFLHMLKDSPVRVVGSEEAASPNVVRLVIEGDTVPDAPLVSCYITREIVFRDIPA